MSTSSTNPPPASEREHPPPDPSPTAPHHPTGSSSGPCATMHMKSSLAGSILTFFFFGSCPLLPCDHLVKCTHPSNIGSLLPPHLTNTPTTPPVSRSKKPSPSGSVSLG